MTMNPASGPSQRDSLKEERRRQLRPWLPQAYRMVYDLLPNKRIAADVVKAALGSIDTAAEVQDDRLEKSPKLARSKTILPLHILFQRLLFIHAEFYELVREASAGTGLGFECMAGGLIKHVMKIGLHNPQYAATGIGRIFLNVPTERLVPIYKHLAPGCPGSTDESGAAWRRLKRIVMGDLTARV